MDFNKIVERYIQTKERLVRQAEIRAYQKACRIHPQTAYKLGWKQRNYANKLVRDQRAGDSLLAYEFALNPAFDLVYKRYPRIFKFFRECCELIWEHYPIESLQSLYEAIKQGNAPLFLPNFLVWHAIGNPFNVPEHLAASNIRKAFIAHGLSPESVQDSSDIPHPVDWHQSFIHCFYLNRSYTDDPWRITYNQWLEAFITRKESENVPQLRV